MPTTRPLRAAARRLSPAALAATALAIAPAPALAYPQLTLEITDRVGLPSDTQPDSASVWSYGGSWGGLVPTGLRIERGGKVIAGAGSSKLSLKTAAIEEGDVLVASVRAVGSNYPGGGSVQYPDYPSELRYTYRRSPAFTAPVCAGAASYSGTLQTPTWYPFFGTAVLWKADPSKQPVVDYGWETPPFPESQYPAWYPGYALADSASVAFFPTGTAFTAVPSKPLSAGARISAYTYSATDDFDVSVTSETEVKDCTPASTPAPTASPASTATPGPTPAPTPVVDRTPPQGGATRPSTKTLTPRAAKRLLRGGVPLTVTTSEPGQLRGTITVLGGRITTKADVVVGLRPGANAIKVIVPNTLRRAVKKVKKKSPKLRLNLVLVDRAGNRTALSPITIKLPKN